MVKLLNAKGKNSNTVGDNTIQAEGLGDFFKNIWRSSANIGKKGIWRAPEVIAKNASSLLP